MNRHRHDDQLMFDNGRIRGPDDEPPPPPPPQVDAAAALNNALRSEQEQLEMDLADEAEMRRTLDGSIRQLEASVSEIEKRLDGIAEESNEWKTRYETQSDMNKFLDRKIVEMQSKADTMRKTIRTGQLYEPNSDASYFVELTERLELEKSQLESQLTDLNWKLDKETKAFIKANDERKQYYLEISSCSSIVEDLKTKLRAHRKTSEAAFHDVNLNKPILGARTSLAASHPPPLPQQHQQQKSDATGVGVGGGGGGGGGYSNNIAMPHHQPNSNNGAKHNNKYSDYS